MALFPRLFRRSTSVVAIGGGTGASGLLRGLKEHTDKLTAVVTVADDGGSSGRFRKEFGMLPPGDIRNCLAALSDAGHRCRSQSISTAVTSAKPNRKSSTGMSKGKRTPVLCCSL